MLVLPTHRSSSGIGRVQCHGRLQYWRESSCLLGWWRRTESNYASYVYYAGYVISTDAIGRESRPKQRRNKQLLSQPIGSSGVHLIWRHELRLQSVETNRSFHVRYWTGPCLSFGRRHQCTGRDAVDTVSMPYTGTKMLCIECPLAGRSEGRWRYRGKRLPLFRLRSKLGGSQINYCGDATPSSPYALGTWPLDSVVQEALEVKLIWAYKNHTQLLYSNKLNSKLFHKIIIRNFC